MTNLRPFKNRQFPPFSRVKTLWLPHKLAQEKTAGFTLPILEMLSKEPRPKPKQVRTLILTPTRELAAQVEASVMTYGKHLKLYSTVVFGSVKINPQIKRLQSGVDILVATPGRLMDLHFGK